MTVVFEQYVRKPFNVEAVEVTVDNIAELAEFIGTLRTKETDGTPYIAVDRRLVPSVYRVFPGYWVTRMGDNVRCYARKIFMAQFVESTEEIDAWVKYINESEGHTAPMEEVTD